MSPQLSPELARGLLPVARSLPIAARTWSLCPPEHPAAAALPHDRDLLLANTWERNDRGDYPSAVIDAIDPESVTIDPLKCLSCPS